jgi:hypothetical protein
MREFGELDFARGALMPETVAYIRYHGSYSGDL